MSTEQSFDIDTLIRRLDTADAMPGAADLRARSYELLQPITGALVVDVGCGAGRAVAELTERGAKAVGVDASERMVAVARRRWPGADVRLADAYELPFGDGELAGYRADKVYHELDDPDRAAAEARRVLAPGGRVVLIGQDWDAFIIESADPALTRTIAQARSATIPAPRVARRYRNLLLDAGFADVTVEVRAAVFTGTAMLPMLEGLAEAAKTTGAVAGEQADAWIAEQTERARTDRMLLAVPLFVAAARRR
ncbi:methyltransferase domain-containing protein [Actinoallomurus vinaceus]